MPELKSILSNMDIILKRLTEILYAEQCILIENGSVRILSKIIDEKSKLLIDLKLLDENREKLSKQHNISAPYSNDTSLATQWQLVVKMTKELSQINHDNGLALQTKMNKTEKSIQFLKSLNNSELYTNVGCKKISSISIKRAEA